MASIQKRIHQNGTSYRVGYRHDGKLRWTHSVATPEAAVVMKDLFDSKGVELALATIAARSGRDAVEGPPLLSEMFEQHLAVVAAHATPGTIDGYRSRAKRSWLPLLGDLPVDKITRTLVSSWVTHQRTVETTQSERARAKAVRLHEPPPEPRYWSPKSIQNAQTLLSETLDAAVEAGHVVKNVAAGIKLPSDHERTEMTFLTTAEFARLLDAMDEYYRPLVSFLAGTGCRWGEATALRPEDFDLESSRPTVRISRSWKRGTNGKVYLGAPKSARGIRTITLPAAVVDQIRAAVRETSAGQHVFRAKRGGIVLNSPFARTYWKPAIASADIGKKPRIHDLRHTHVSWLIADGVPLPVIQRRLGHESIKTTVDRYGHLTPDAHWGAAEAADRALAESFPQIETRDGRLWAAEQD